MAPLYHYSAARTSTGAIPAIPVIPLPALNQSAAACLRRAAADAYYAGA